MALHLRSKGLELNFHFCLLVEVSGKLFIYTVNLSYNSDGMGIWWKRKMAENSCIGDCLSLQQMGWIILKRDYTVVCSVPRVKLYCPLPLGIIQTCTFAFTLNLVVTQAAPKQNLVHTRDRTILTTVLLLKTYALLTSGVVLTFSLYGPVTCDIWSLDTFLVPLCPYWPVLYMRPVQNSDAFAFACLWCCPVFVFGSVLLLFVVLQWENTTV